MFTRVLRAHSAAAIALALLFAQILSGSPEKNMTRSVIGELESVDSGARRIVVELADDTEHAFKVTDQTAIHGMEAGAKAIALAGKEGSYVIVHYTKAGADKTAAAIEYLGRETPRTGEGTLVRVDQAARTVVAKMADGTEDTFRMAERATIDTGHGAVKLAALVGKEGESVIVHYTTEGGRKIARLIQYMGRPISQR